MKKPVAERTHKKRVDSQNHGRSNDELRKSANARSHGRNEARQTEARNAAVERQARFYARNNNGATYKIGKNPCEKGYQPIFGAKALRKVA